LSGEAFCCVAKAAAGRKVARATVGQSRLLPEFGSVAGNQPMAAAGALIIQYRRQGL
jgi:hypothetical protein